MKGYVPEGNYFLLREMFEVETLGATDLTNWTADTNIEVVAHPDADPTTRNNYYNKYKCLRMNHNSSATHRTRIESNAFVQEVTVLIYVPSGTPHGAKWRIRMRDAAGTNMCGMAVGTNAGGLLTPWYNGGATAAIWKTAVDTISEDAFHELKCYIHNANSPTPDRVEFFFDGYKVWYDEVATNYVRDKTKTEELKKAGALGNELSYIDIVSNNTAAGNYCLISGISIKEWADMNETSKDKFPFVQVLLQNNDRATFTKLRDYVTRINMSERFNENTEATLDMAFRDLNDMMENYIVDEDDTDWQHTTFDRRALIFLQQSQLIFHSYLAANLAGTLTDTLADYVTYGVLPGDKVWIFENQQAINNPYTITTVTDATHIVINDPGINLVNISYMIVRGQERIKQSSLGDYIFQGKWKNYDYNWSGTPKLTMTLLSNLYTAIQKHIWCDTSIYYYKKLEEILTGRFRFDSAFPLAPPNVSHPDQVIGNSPDDPSEDALEYFTGNYKGLLGTRFLDYDTTVSPATLRTDELYHTMAFLRNITDVGTDNQEAPITKRWEPGMTLYEAISSLADTMALQYQSFTDLEMRDERVVFFRDKKDKEGTPLLNFWNGELFPGFYTLTEDDREIMSMNIGKGTREFVDYVRVQGSLEVIASEAIPIIADKPDNYDVVGTTRDAVKNNGSILLHNIAELNAITMLRDLSRKPEEGSLMTEPISLQETWYNDIYTSDLNVFDYYGRLATEDAGYFMGDSDWNTYVIGAIPKDRTSQGHLYRKPFSLIGEIMRIYITDARFLNATINSWSFAYSDMGITIAVEPDVQPYQIARDFTQIKREIEWTEQKLATVDTIIQPCDSVPLHKSLAEFGRYIDVGRTPDAVSVFYKSGDASPPAPAGIIAGRIYFEFDPFYYQDVNDSDSAYGYAFFASDTGVWGNWDPCPVRNGPNNMVTDIDDSTPSIEFNNDPAQYGLTGGNNYVFLDISGLPWYTGAGQNVWIKVVLVTRHDMDASPVVIHYVPRDVTPGSPYGDSDFDETNSGAVLGFWNGVDERYQIITFEDGPFAGVL